MSIEQHPGLSPMNEQQNVSVSPTRRPIRTAAILILVALLSMVYIAYVLIANSEGLSPLRALGPVLQMESGGAVRAYMITGQWRTHTLTTGRYVSSTTTRTDLYVDLWAFNANDAKPLWRKRLQTQRNGSMSSREILGGEANTVWLLVQGNLLGMSADTGEVIAPVGTVESRNPELEGKMPVEGRYYRFDIAGLSIKAADGRDWRIDGTTFAATVIPANAEVIAKTDAYTPAFYTPQGTALFRDRGLAVPGHWLGMLTEAEAKNFAEQRTPGGLDSETRRRLWHARVVEKEAFQGTYPVCEDFEPLSAAPEVLDGGLLVEYRSGQNAPPLWLREPDSVLLLHRERLGNAGRLRLARITGPEGTVLWEAILPLSVLQSVIRGKESLLLFGTEWPEPDPTQLSDPSQNAPERLLAIDLATGAVHVHDHAAVTEHPAAVPVSLGL